jgi:hypothetical protein
MSTYKELVGKYVRSESSDPPTAYAEGQLWYNTTSNTFKAAPLVGAFSSGGNLPQDSRGGGSAGSQTAAWYVGGLQYPSDTKNRTDEYNGSSWTNVNNLPTNTFVCQACGTLTAGLIFGSNQGYGTCNCII